MGMSRAQIEWGEDGLPRSRVYGDVYFSIHNPLAETQHVFLEGNNLPQRFQELSEYASFTIMETGFGTGLNFLCAWELWCNTRPVDDHAVLHFISIEKHPLALEDLARAHEHWPQLAPLCAALQDNYPALTDGVHSLILDGGRVRLTLLFGEISEMLAACREGIAGQVDAWFLDGFAPAKNDAMWHAEIFSYMVAFSAPQASFATFTAAGAVRRGLQEVGFAVQKTKGFGHKRDMSVGKLALHKPAKPSRMVEHVIVIGAGMAGANVAYSLAQRGVRVTVLEQHDAPAQGTSGNPAGVLFPMLHKSWDAQMRFYASAHHLTRARIAALRHNGHVIRGASCGMVQIPKYDVAGDHAKRFDQISQQLCLDSSFAHYTNASELSALAGIEIAQAGFYFPSGTWVHVPDYVQALLRHTAITIHCKQCATTLNQHATGAWCVQTQQGEAYVADAVILANAEAATHLLPHHPLPLRTIQGQVSFIPTMPALASLRSIVCYSGYLTPAHNGLHSIGATYHHQRKDTLVTSEDHWRNLEDAHTYFPSLSLTSSYDVDALAGRAGLRVVSKDRMPIIGMLPDTHVGFSLAHGSRGLLSSSLGAELLCAQLMREPYPCSDDVMKMLQPMRFHSL